MKYLNTKPGSIEEVVANMSKHQNESDYQDMFKKELEKAGKGIGAMTPAEKKAFFNKIDDKYKAKNEDIKEAVDNPYAVGMAVAKKMKNDEPPLKKSTITKAHDIAKSIKKDEVKEEKETCTKCEGKGCEHCDMKGYHIKEAKEGYGEQVIKAAKMYMKDSSCTYEMAAEKYGCSAEQVRMCAKEMMNKDEVEESAASDKAKAMGLTYLHFGRYGKDGKVTHKNIGGNLTRVGKDEKPIKSSDKASKDQPNKSSKVTSDVVDIEPRELKKQAKKYGLTVKIGSGDPDDGYEVEFKGPQKNLVKYYKNHMGYDGKDFKGLDGLGDISENYPHKMYSKDGKEVEAKTPEDHKKYADMGYTHKKETHSFMTKDMNKSKKDAKGEKEIVDPEPKLKQESIQDAIANVWKMSAEELEKIKTEAKYMKSQRMSQYKAEDEKNKKGTADTGSKETKVDVEPKVDYKN